MAGAKRLRGRLAAMGIRGMLLWLEWELGLENTDLAVAAGG